MALDWNDLKPFVAALAVGSAAAATFLGVVVPMVLGLFDRRR